jgi:hypothetical protein
MTLPIYLEEKFTFFVPTEVTLMVIHMPVLEMAHQVSVIGVVLEAPTPFKYFASTRTTINSSLNVS